MSDINSITISGRLTKDVELQHTPGGRPFARTSLATDMSFKGGDGKRVERTVFSSLKAWGPVAESFAKWFGKGDPVLIQGEITENHWDRNGVKVESYSIVVTGWFFHGPRKSGKGDQGRPQTAPTPKAETVDRFDDGDDVPF